MVGSTRLYWVLWQMGFDAHQCRFLEREFNRLRLCNLGADDWGRIIEAWKERAVLTATSTIRAHLHRLMGIPRQCEPTLEEASLFDEELRTME